MQPSSRVVTANGLRHHVLEWDGGGTTTAFCVHGFLDLGWGFASVAERLAAAGYHVVAPDLRGHGRSERIGAGGYYHFADYVPDVADLIDATCRETLLLVGHSMGGSVATYYAGTFPEKVWRLVVMEGIHVPESDVNEMPSRMANWIRTVRRARTMPNRAYATLEEAAGRLRALDPRCPPEVALFLAEKSTALTPDGWAFLHDPVHLTRGPYPYRLDQARTFWRNIACPVLFVEGAESEFLQIPGVEERYAEFRDVHRASIAGAGHMMMRHQPEAVARAILDFAKP